MSPGHRGQLKNKSQLETKASKANLPPLLNFGKKRRMLDTTVSLSNSSVLASAAAGASSRNARIPTELLNAFNPQTLSTSKFQQVYLRGAPLFCVLVSKFSLKDRAKSPPLPASTLQKIANRQATLERMLTQQQCSKLALQSLARNTFSVVDAC